jgi:hypothetical protein
VPKEIDLFFDKYTGQYVTLPAGRLLVSGPKFSFCPEDGQIVYGYEIGDGGNVAGYYLNGQRVSFETWRIAIATDEGLRNSNFGEKPLHGMRNLTTREASRFLEVEKSSTLLKVEEPSVPLEVEKSSTLPDIKKSSDTLGMEESSVLPIRKVNTRTQGHRKARWVVRYMWL